MAFHLRSYDLSPPGGFPYEQTEGIYRKFQPVPIIEEQAKTVAAFRQANGLPRSGLQETLADIDAFQCSRLGNPSNFCVDSENPSVALGVTSPIISPCKGCGAKV